MTREFAVGTFLTASTSGGTWVCPTSRRPRVKVIPMVSAVSTTPDFPDALIDGLFRTHQPAPGTAVAKIGKNDGLPGQGRDGIELANISTLAAMLASVLVHHRQGQFDSLRNR